MKMGLKTVIFLAIIFNCYKSIILQADERTEKPRMGQLHDFRNYCSNNLYKPLFDWIDEGSEDEWTLKENTPSFKKYRILPGNYQNVSIQNLETKVQGKVQKFPIGISAISRVLHLVDSDGELALARRKHHLFNNN